jgi:diguanylate cyclase (GGDEF)-like protein
MALHDPLTLLANRSLFRDRVEHAVAVSKRNGRAVAVVFVDLDNFKNINDSFGHATGDRVLHKSAQRLVKATRGGDTVARLGGDEFAVLLENLAPRNSDRDAGTRRRCRTRSTCPARTCASRRASAWRSPPRTTASRS